MNLSTTRTLGLLAVFLTTQLLHSQPDDIPFPEPEPTPETVYGPPELDIFEAVFRYMLDHNASGSQKNTNYFFFELMDEDPDDAFLKRFTDIKPPVVPASKGKPSEYGHIVNIDDNLRGIVFGIGGYKRKEDGTCLVYGGYYEANMSSSGCTYTVRLIEGVWTVTNRVVNMISDTNWDNKSFHTTPVSLRDTSVV